MESIWVIMPCLHSSCSERFAALAIVAGWGNAVIDSYFWVSPSSPYSFALSFVLLATMISLTLAESI